MNIKKSQCYIHNTTMNKGYTYELESDIDFFQELKKISAGKGVPSELSVAQSTDSESNQRCLITDEMLRKDHITLECGHKFNYVPLFKDVLFQKCSLLPKNISSKIITMYTKQTPHIPASNSNSIISSTPVLTPVMQNSNVLSVTYNSSYNLETTKLHYNEIKCPYCRSITPNILPYYPYPDVSKVKYVNNPPNLALPGLTCEYDKFVNGDSEFATILEQHTCKSQCLYNEKYDIMLCNKHLNKLESRSQTKQKSSSSSSVSSSSSPHRRSSRISNKKPNTKTHDNDTNEDTQNIIVSHHNPATTVCSFTLLSGPRKGSSCGKPMWIPKTTDTPINTIHDAGSQAYCKVHYEKMKTTITSS
jgi:hypothetical protein